MLTQKRYLIIDDSTTFVALARSILLDAGVGNDNIHSTLDSLKAFRLLVQHQFDVVLCDYNMGSNIDGGLILDEIRQRRLLSPQGVFFCITGDSSKEVVTHFIEMEPDDYLTKPFRYQDLIERLKVAIKRKEALYPLLQALENRAWQTVVDLTDHYLDRHPEFAQYLHRVHGDCLLRMRRHQDALEFYREQAQLTEQCWPIIGMGQALQGLGELEAAEQMFARALANDPANPVAQRTLAACILAKDDYPRALKQFQELHQLSPANPLRMLVIANLFAILGQQDNAAIHYEKYIDKVKDTNRYTLGLHIHTYLCLLFATYRCDNPKRRQLLLNEARHRLTGLAQRSEEQEEDHSPHPGFQLAAGLFAMLEGKVELGFHSAAKLTDRLDELEFHLLLDAARLFGLCGLPREYRRCLEQARQCCESVDDDTVMLSQVKLLMAVKTETEERLQEGSRLAESAQLLRQRPQAALEQAVSAFASVPFLPALSLLLLELLGSESPSWMEPAQRQTMLDGCLWLYQHDSRTTAEQKSQATRLYQKALDPKKPGVNQTETEQTA
ncbi:response regulator [Ferrimonas sp. YFM]|uniref:response regulator n=1 Tax=Ferrimonas sp. YFM TaxID=3028878 RepID=UPI002572E95B|nr:response regulator [Ferrimonas sp. YFM]BDY05917.1 response regulator [Ferrimonas sp. YFM]